MEKHAGNELQNFLSSGDICCSDLVPMVTVPVQTEIFIRGHTFPKGERKKRKCGSFSGRRFHAYVFICEGQMK